MSSEQKPLEQKRSSHRSKRSRLSLRFIVVAIVGLLILNVAAIILLRHPR